MRTATVGIPQPTKERIPVPAALLTPQCVGVRLSDATDIKAFEDVAARLWGCVQDLNHQLEEIGALK